jgi:hypothetical protein
VCRVAPKSRTKNVYGCPEISNKKMNRVGPKLIASIM